MREVNIPKFELVNSVQRKVWLAATDKTHQFTVYNAAETAVENITGWALSWRLFKSRTDREVLLSRTVGDGITITNGAGGICQVAITDTLTAGFPEGWYWHELYRTDAGYKTPLAGGDAWLWAGDAT